MVTVTDTTSVDEPQPRAPDADAASASASASTGGTGGTTLRYNPGFDGIRGLAVAAVLLFHHGVSWAPGGYLGVSTFFTLSGFLITSLLIAEHARSGKVRLSAFWARRLRRLLPASSLTLVGIAGLAMAVDAPWEQTVREDVLAGVGQVANWRFLLAERSYAELFTDQSPVLHFWSLAIEEQFYWVFPLLTFAVLRAARGSLRAYGAVLAVLIGASAAYTLSLGADNSDAVYYSTFTRMAEILLGALLAVVLALASQSRLLQHRLVPIVATGVGGLALLASLFAWNTVDRTDEGLYRGGLLLYALLSVGLVGAAVLSSQVRRGLGWGPLRWLGLVSYAAYLFHWPIYLVLDSERTDLGAGSWQLGALRIGVTLAAAALSYRFLEQPIRQGRWPVSDAPRWAGGAVASVVVVALLQPVISPPPPADPFAEALRASEKMIDDLPDRIPRVLVLGDSTALLMGGGAGNWGIQNEEMAVAGFVAEIGCPLGRGGKARQSGSILEVDPERCDWAETWPALIEEQDPEAKVAVILTGAWDVLDRKLPGDDRWRSFGDRKYDEFMRGEMTEATQLLLDHGLKVVWLTSPLLDFGRNQDPRPRADPADGAERVARLNELIGEVVDSNPGVGLVDYGGYFAGLDPAEDARLRPDGVHLEMSTADEVGLWLGPQIMAVAALPEPVSGS